MSLTARARSWLWRWRHLWVAAAICAAVMLALFPGLLADPLGSRPVGPFHDGHIWCLRQMARALVGLEPWSPVTHDVGWPAGADARFIAWGAALIAAPLQPLLGPVGAYNAALLGGPVLSVLCCGWLLRALGASRPVAAAAALIAVVSPWLLGSVAGGQVAKVQLWVFALWGLAALGLLRGGRRPVLRLAAVVCAAALVGFTAPSLALFLPLVLLALLPVLGRVHGGWRAGLLRWGLLVAMTGLVLGGCLLVYALPGASDVPEAFSPAGRASAAAMMSKTLGSLLLPFMPRRLPEGPLMEVPHLANLPWVAMLAGGLGLWLRPRGWRAAGLLLLLAAAAVLGFWPGGGEGAGGATPVGRWLLSLGVPALAFYRASFLAVAALAALLALGASQRPWGALVAWGLALGVVGETLLTHQWMLPLDTAPLPGRATLEGIAADPDPGALLLLPVDASGLGGQRAVALAAVHGRPSNGVPRRLDPKVPGHAELRARLVELEGHAGAELVEALREQGVAWVVWHELEGDHKRSPWFQRGPTPGALSEALGEPVGDVELRAWKVGD